MTSKFMILHVYDIYKGIEYNLTNIAFINWIADIDQATLWLELMLSTILQ